MFEELLCLEKVESINGFFEPVQEIRFGNKIIICRQAYYENHPYGIVAGYKASEPYRRYGISAIKVELISPHDRERIRESLRCKLKGPINFWC